MRSLAFLLLLAFAGCYAVEAAHARGNDCGRDRHDCFAHTDRYQPRPNTDFRAWVPPTSRHGWGHVEHFNRPPGTNDTGDRN